MMPSLFDVILPVFASIALGFIWVKARQPFDTATLSALVANLGAPALLLSSLSRADIAPAALGQTLAAGALALAALAALGALALKLLRWPVRPFLPALMMPNTGNMGLPIVAVAFGPEGAVYGIAISTLVQIGHFTVGMWLASGQRSLRPLFATPALYAMLLALALVGTGTRLPPWLADLLRLIAGIAVPLMLLLMGASLTRFRVQALARSLVLAVLRLGLGVTVGLAVAWALRLDPVAGGTLVIQCAMPVAVFSYLFALKYAGPAEEVAAAIALSTALSLATLPLLLAVAR
ncbi:MAG TPA: AEC family transporter [Azospirillaceae bacterium]|nr:AEC family transporter [Azospirillaceae bacterium]